MSDDDSVGIDPPLGPPDTNLWVTIRHVGKVYLIGSAHTYFGRIAGYSEALGGGYIFSKGEVEEYSTGAALWLEGFLAGNEPDLDEYLGFPEVWDLADSDPDVSVGLQRVADFGRDICHRCLDVRIRSYLQIRFCRKDGYGIQPANRYGSGMVRVGQLRYHSHSS